MTEEISMKDIMGDIESTMKKIHRGDIVKGRVISVSDKEVVLNIGYISDGIVKKEEFLYNEEENLKDFIKENDEVYVYVLDINDGEGNVVLSKKKADEENAWKELIKSFKSQEILEVTVENIVKGGVTAYINGIRAFIPASHIDNKYIDSLENFKGKKLEVKLIELDRKKGKVVLSRKIVLQEKEKIKIQKLWDNLKKGEKVKGTVRRLERFGAFVDIGGVDGLIHNSQLSWGRVNHPSEVVSIGDEVEVYILDFDKETKRIALALKNIKENPWNTVADKFKQGDVVEGTVVKLLNFGAFVEVEKGIEGLVHISEISNENIAKPSEKLNLQDKVKVKVLEIDPEEKRMSLSIKEAIEKPAQDFSKYDDSKEENTTLGDLFGDKLKDLF
ncbi:30S ribosomal protein S1 [Clostridium niameyense]|uniref:30S ribosomal protein S1 n=1 Tax=Clostridium niameyense TaxID=1622073 RepID=UPI00067EA70A|nr:30S ribosomal protein S1 [Clostridium niameyense]